MNSTPHTVSLTSANGVSSNKSIAINNAPDWNQITALEIIGLPTLHDGKELHVNSTAGCLIFSITDYGVRLRSIQQRDYDYGLLNSKPESLPLTLEQNDTHSRISIDVLSVEIEHQPFAFAIYQNSKQKVIESATDGHFVRRYRVPPIAKTTQGWLLSFALKSNEPVYGLGEKWGSLNKRGQLIRSYNHDALGVNAEISYKNVPFCWSPEGWGVFSHTPAPVTHAVGFADWSQRSYCTLVEDDVLDLFIFATEPSGLGLANTTVHPETCLASNAGAVIIKKFTALTGRAPVPEAWTTGVILSKAYYKTADEILDAAQQVRDRGMPCDVITFDGRAWQDTATRFAFEWSPSRYPDPASVVDQLKQLNFKICVWEYPLVAMSHAWFKEFASKGWFLTDRRTGKAFEYEWDRQAFGDVLTPLPKSGIVDFTHPEAYAFWRDQHKALFDLGVDMIKADFGEQVTDNNMLAHNGESGHALHNVYAHLYNRCVYEAAEKYSPSGPFLFSRACWTGSQRFNSHWGGDPQADWEGMISNIRGGLSWGLSGAPFYATDVGGFFKDTRDDKLYVRWAQAAIFSAHFRLHGIGSREPWSYSAEAEGAVNSALKLRYQLQAYLMQAMAQSNATGLPVQRPMVLAFPQERQSWEFENQFMFGEDLLVVPCFDPDDEVEFYLPEGHWYPFEPGTDHSHDLLVGQRVYRHQVALSEIKVFARSGTKISLCKAVEFTEQHFSDSASGQLAIEQTWVATSTN